MSSHLRFPTTAQPLAYECWAGKNTLTCNAGLGRCDTNAGGSSGVLSWWVLALLCVLCFAAGYLVGFHHPAPARRAGKRGARTACTQTAAWAPSAQTAVEGTGEVDPLHCAPAAAADARADDCGDGEGDGAVECAGTRITSCQCVSRLDPE